MPENINPDANPLYDPDGNRFTDALIEHWEQNQIVNHKNQSVMNEKNVAYLKDNLKYLGFGENLNNALLEGIREGKKDFTLTLYTEINKTPLSATLYFSKSESSEMYFFNRWQATLKQEEGKVQQTFYLNRGHGITLKEGYNLLQGRAVYKELSDKEGQKYHAWLQINKQEMDTNGNYKMNQYHQNYGYDLEKTLAPLPIKELTDSEQREALLRSLQKGNLQAVGFEKAGFIEKLFIEAAPQFKSINAYDHNGTKVPMNLLEKRFDFSMKQAKMDEITLLGKIIENTSGKVISGQGDREIKNDEKKEAQGQNKSKGEGLLPKKEKANGLMEKKKSARGKGLHP